MKSLSAPGASVSRFTTGHLKRETKTKEGLFPATFVRCETMKRETLTYHVFPAAFPFHGSFHDRRSIVGSALARFVLRFTFYSPQQGERCRFRLRFCSFLVSEVCERNVKRKGGRGRSAVEVWRLSRHAPFSASARSNRHLVLACNASDRTTKRPSL
jgi:hypothetical protein